MLERVAYHPSKAPSNEAAKAYMPTFLYHDPENPSRTEIRDEFFGSRKKLRLGILGAGITCVNFLHFLEAKTTLEALEIVVYERESDVGGVVSMQSLCSCYRIRISDTCAVDDF